MKIKRSLPQFKRKRALLIVTGKKVAEIFEAISGVITRKAEIKIPNQKYSDREGHFKTRTNRNIIRSGSVHEPNENIEKDKLKKEVSENVKKLFSNREYKEVYLFSPNYLIKEMRSSLPKDVQEKITLSIRGNFTEEHPHTILEKIKKVRKKSTDNILPIRKKARKLLKKNKIKIDK